jgi:hypothetical protein
VYNHPNPIDPFDGFKRWYRQLWPLEQLLVWVIAAVLAIAAGFWVTM